MQPSLPFEPPNEHICIALYNPLRNTWWLVMCTHSWEKLNPWEQAIKATGGTIDNHYAAASLVSRPHLWSNFQTEARQRIKDGFCIVAGGLDEVHASGTRWLRSAPNLWWEMHSASVAQLNVIQECQERCELVLGALALQGHFGNKIGTPGRRGPSVVEHRWKAMFPAEMAFAQQCIGLGIGPYDALTLWKSLPAQVNLTIPSQEFAELLSTPDLR